MRLRTDYPVCSAVPLLNPGLSGMAPCQLCRAAVMEPSAQPGSRPEEDGAVEVENGWRRLVDGKWEQVR